MRALGELLNIPAMHITASKAIIAFVLVLVSLVGVLPASAQWANGYTYRRTITIDHTKVPNTDQSNFPVLISGTYSYLATTGNGGNVTNANGYDIIFTSDSGGSSTLAFEQESYSASTGAVNYWVKVATVSHTTDTVIYLFYGNSSVTTDQSNKTGVWDSNYKAVWHMNDNAANTTVKDSTSNGYNGTAAANTSGKSTTGEIGHGLSFNGTSDGISTSLAPTNVFTWEAWFNASSMSSYGSIIVVSGNYMLMQIESGTATIWMVDYSGHEYNFGITGLSTGTWYHMVFSRSGDSGTYRAYLNGSLMGTLSSSTWSITNTLQLGERAGYSQYFAGTLDELRVSNSVRSADWISAEYKNQSSPSTFYSVGSATTCVSITSLSPTWGEIDSAVTITGTNFGSTQGSSTVTFNGTSATPTSWSTTSIATTVPSGATTGNVVVTVSSVASNGVSFTVSSGGGSDSSGIYYYFSDQLGTARVITDASGTVCYDGDMYPYGGERAYTDVCDSNYKFTGKERDSESGLDNFGARYYSSQYGRFMIPDWAAKATAIPYAVFGNPQTLNLYAIVHDNPESYADLDGHQCSGNSGEPGGCAGPKQVRGDDEHPNLGQKQNTQQTQQTQEHQQYEQAKAQHNQQMAEKMNPTATDSDRMKAASDGAKMADTGVKAGLAFEGAGLTVVAGTAVVTSATVLAATQTAGAVAETYIGTPASTVAGTYVSGVSTVNDFVQGVRSPASMPLTPGGAIGAAVRLVYDFLTKP